VKYIRIETKITRTVTKDKVKFFDSMDKLTWEAIDNTIHGPDYKQDLDMKTPVLKTIVFTGVLNNSD